MAIFEFCCAAIYPVRNNAPLEFLTGFNGGERCSFRTPLIRFITSGTLVSPLHPLVAGERDEVRGLGLANGIGFSNHI